LPDPSYELYMQKLTKSEFYLAMHNENFEKQKTKENYASLAL